MSSGKDEHNSEVQNDTFFHPLSHVVQAQVLPPFGPHRRTFIFVHGVAHALEFVALKCVRKVRETSRGIRNLHAGILRGARSGLALRFHGARTTLARVARGSFANPSRRARGAFGKLARGTRGNSRNARRVFERHGGREALAARSRCWRVARKALEERIRNAREAVVGGSRSLARRLRGAHGMLAGRSRNGRSARAVFARRL